MRMRLSDKTWLCFSLCIPGFVLILASRGIDGNPIVGGIGVLIIVSAFMWIGSQEES